MKRCLFVLRCHLTLISLWPIVICSNPVPETNRSEASIVDDSTGEPLVARVAITNSQGQFVEIEGQHAHVQYLDKRWCYVNRSFSLTTPASGIGLEIRHGFEVRPIVYTLPDGGAGKTELGDRSGGTDKEIQMVEAAGVEPAS